MYTFELFFHSFFLSPNRNIYETMDHVNNAARRSREREKVEGWKLGIQLSPQDGWALWEKGSRPTKKKKKTTTGRTNNQQPIRIFMHLLFVLHFFPVDNRRNQKTRRPAKDKKRKKEKNDRNVWLDQQQHAPLSPKITHGSYTQQWMTCSFISRASVNCVELDSCGTKFPPA
jgi:hypothetical protein